MYRQKVDETVRFLRTRMPHSVRFGIILGTGLGGLAGEIQTDLALSFEEIPHFAVSTVASHHGRLLFGTMAGVPVIALQGRLHLYEGYTPYDVTLPVRVMASLGITALVLSNAAGGMNPQYRKGDLMVLTDHINLQGHNPLMGHNFKEWGPRFPDMSEPYDPKLRSIAAIEANKQGIKLHEGVYVAVMGPTLETKAEYRMLRRLGADAVGMSTVPEVIVARHMNVKVLAFSVITDECFPDTLAPVDLDDLLRVASDAEPRLTSLMKAVIVEADRQD